MKDLIEEIDRRFVSGNEVPVERAHIRATEWAELRAALERVAQEARVTVLHEVNRLFCHGLSSSLGLEFMRSMHDRWVIERVRQALLQVPRWNCDCLPAGPDGRPAPDGVEGIHRERDVVLVEDLFAALEEMRDA